MPAITRTMMKNPELEIYRRRLPHWRFEGSVSFVTWRLHHNQKILSPKERELVLSAIKHFENVRYQLYAFVVMDNHVHVIVQPYENNRMQDITYSWKSFTAHKLQREYGRVGAMWQDESFDRIIRSEAEFLEKVNYILNNPRKKWPEVVDYPWVGLAE